MTSEYCIILSFILVYCFLGCDSSWIPSRSVRQVPLDEVSQPQEDVEPPQLDDILKDNTTISRKDENQNSQFWLLRDDTTTEADAVVKETVTQPILAEETAESTTPKKDAEGVGTVDKQEILEDPQWPTRYDMDEVILLPRNNCNLEVQVNEWEDKKMRMEYEGLKNGTSGQCRTAVRGKNGVLLAVFVSDVRFNTGVGEKGSREVLRVVTGSNNFNFTIREYRGGEEYYPVILTDSNQVFLVLSYNGKESLRARSSFNLEVFNYYKNENQVNLPLQDEGPYGPSVCMVASPMRKVTITQANTSLTYDVINCFTRGNVARSCSRRRTLQPGNTSVAYMT